MGTFERRKKPEARGGMLSFRVAPTEVTFLRTLAEERGLTLADVIREAIDEYVSKRRPPETEEQPA
jgi:predicted DNA-binding protein